MKKLILLTVAAAALAFAPGKAAAAPSPFNISGMATYNLTNYMKGSNYVAKTVTMSFNNKSIYSWLISAVADASNGLAATLPSKGYLDYEPEAYDGKYFGTFFVKDTTGFSYALSGLDTNGQHYSFAELSTYDWFFGKLGRGDCCCCCCGSSSNSTFTASNSVYMANISELTGFGSYSASDTAQFSIHSDPYWSQHNNLYELTLVGTFKPKLTLKYDFPYRPSTAEFIGSGTIGVTWGNVTDGYTYYRGIISGASLKFDF